MVEGSAREMPEMTVRLPSPLEAVQDPRLGGVRLLLKRDDLIHPEVPGNKWRKLKNNLDAARVEGYDRILTFGGVHAEEILPEAEQAVREAAVGVLPRLRLVPLPQLRPHARLTRPEDLDAGVEHEEAVHRRERPSELGERSRLPSKLNRTGPTRWTAGVRQQPSQSRGH